MKVLIVFEDKRDTDNLFIPLLAHALRVEGIDIYCSVNEFWHPHTTYDIIHFQWPEEVVVWNCKDVNIDEKLFKQIDFHRRTGAQIIYTRHNTRPHYGNPMIEIAYGIIEACSDLIVHMGLWSLEEFKITYPNSNNIIIPHHLYETAYNTSIDKNKARKFLGIPIGKLVIVSFGKFRDNEERKMVLKAFRNLKIKNTYLLAPRFYPFNKNAKWSDSTKSWVQKIIYNTCCLANRLLFNIQSDSNGAIIPHHELPYYLAASDIIFIQRRKILNSGNLPLGFLFRKVVVGPDTGNVGEILRATGNPVFNPYHEQSVVDALRRAIKLQKEGIGEQNYNYAIAHFGIKKIGQMYREAYKSVLNKHH